MAILSIMFFVVNLLFFSIKISSETDIITQFLPLHDGSTLVNGAFELGFFSPGSSTNRYVGIWFKTIPLKTVVWVANRDNPISDKSGILSVNKEGNLVLLSKNGTTHWSTNVTTKPSTSSFIAKLLGTGNLVVNNEKDHSDHGFYLWQSFDYPSDTILPGMKLGWNLTSGLNRQLTAWKNWDDPSSGQTTYGYIRSDNPESEIRNGSSMIYRSGPFNGIRFAATQKLKHVPLFNVDFVYKKDEYYFSYEPKNRSLLSRIVINQTISTLQRLTWSEENQRWMFYLNVPREECDIYNRCSSFGICAMTGKSSMCDCLTGFTPKSPRKWSEKDWSQGCVHNETWRCREKNKDGFIKFQHVKVPDTKQVWIDRSMTLEKCKGKCWENCSCTAYANTNILGNGSGCILWFGDLLDLRELPDAGQDLYVRSPVSETEETRIMKTKVKRNEMKQEDLELPLFDFGTVTFATNDFSNDNKLGEGGFGPVYKGTLPDGQDIAVKRLSHTSTQGINEFKNEVVFCSKLQHRNLVKVLGFCIEEHEKLLIYEYMPNKSLDFFLFDSSRSKVLDWYTRFNIIGGIARGLLYLHQDSRLRIIHRDLKASNILLDNDLSPKISDFGLARMCGGDQIQGTTSRVVGTYGYMAPEYAIDGIFSIKSDVYSFGILLLEIINGKRNKGLSYSNHSYNLIGHAWRLWKECIPMEFLDTCLEDGSYIQSEVLRCIHIGLLCVQQYANDRPTMTSVLVMLTSDSTLPQPKEPIFLTDEFTSEQKISYSTNEVSITMLEPR
ncbi:S-locus lectin kinase family protein [Medicago truncatula]|uniref:Receptor-like serine/threonine-protein kinase n=1 Tax=Medicago truncatula TaxID=3880 RepID=A0A072TQF1_MEDTR|nr:S-locus lectin kinase family protein [Medicago truncatula]